MAVRARLVEALKRWAAAMEPAAAPAVEEQVFVEAAGRTIEDEDEGWRRLTGNSQRDLNPITQERMQDLAVYQWRTNPLANRLIELPLAYLLAEGVSLTVPDEEAQGWLDAFWRDPINAMDIKLAKKVREMALFGEQCWPVFVNEVNGHVRLGYLDPGQIETVVTDPDNIEQPIGVVVKRNNRKVKRRFRVIVNGPESIFSANTQRIRESFTDGECFYFPVNDLSNSARGHSDLLAELDWLDGYDQALFGELERWGHLRAFLWDVTLEGATKEEVEARAREIAPPSAGSVRVHNSSEKWVAVTPALDGSDNAATARLFRNHALGGGSIPEHWFGGGGDVNRATAGEMGEPVVKILTMRQRYWGYILVQVATYVIRRKLGAYYGSEPEQSEEPENYVPVAEFPELTARDTSKFAAALAQVVVASATAIDRGLLSEETAVGIIALIAQQLGREIDPVSELEAARADLARRGEADSFPGFPADEPEPDPEADSDE
jgi:hypothetical protein